MGDREDSPNKLIVLGLPWETNTGEWKCRPPRACPWRPGCRRRDPLPPVAHPPGPPPGPPLARAACSFAELMLVNSLLRAPPKMRQRR